MGIQENGGMDYQRRAQAFSVPWENTLEGEDYRQAIGLERFLPAHEVQKNPLPVVAELMKGGVVVVPTDTLYGLAARIHNEVALERLFRIKGRSLERQIPVLIEKPEKMVNDLVAELPLVAEKLIDRFWPGPLTLVLPARKGLSKLITGNTQAVGIRQAGHPVTRAIIEALGEPITGTSANVTGAPAPFRLEQISTRLLQQVDRIIEGGILTGSKGSTVLDLTSKEIRILRQGDLPLERIREVISL